MFRLMLVPLLAATLLGCSSEEGKQVSASAVMGSALGIPGGPIGVVVGGAAGAVAAHSSLKGLLKPRKKLGTNRV